MYCLWLTLFPEENSPTVVLNFPSPPASTGRGLNECPSIIVAAIGMKFTGIGIMAFYFAALICGAYVGKVAQNSSRISTVPGVLGSDIGTCYSGPGIT